MSKEWEVNLRNTTLLYLFSFCYGGGSAKYTKKLALKGRDRPSGGVGIARGGTAKAKLL